MMRRLLFLFAEKRVVKPVKGDEARIEARSWMLDARVSSFEGRVSIRASTTLNEILFSFGFSSSS
jgi:hypothetical protein